MRLGSPVSHRSWVLTTAVATAATLALAPLNLDAGQKPEQKADQNKKPSISLRANPPVCFSPLRVVVTAELKGGADDYEDFYCASVEWDWGDDTKSESKADCDPYEAGKSEIKRRFVIDHVYNFSGDYRVEFRLKQKKKVVARGSADVKVRPGIRDGGR